MPESIVLQGVTLVICWDHSVQIHAILCCMYLPYQYQQIRQWLARHPRFPHSLIYSRSQLATHAALLWLASTTVPQGWQNPVNFAQSHYSFCCGKVFPRNSAIDLMGHIVSLVHELYSMMVPSCEILVTKLHSVMILVVLYI